MPLGPSAQYFAETVAPACQANLRLANEACNIANLLICATVQLGSEFAVELEANHDLIAGQLEEFAASADTVAAALRQFAQAMRAKREQIDELKAAARTWEDEGEDWKQGGGNAV